MPAKLDSKVKILGEDFNSFQRAILAVASLAF